VIIYRTWDSYDMANSDEYWPNLKGAVAHLREAYGIKKHIKLDENGAWEGRPDPKTADTRIAEVYIERLDITVTRKGLCRALKLIPHR
jgi:hypothetical protein